MNKEIKEDLIMEINLIHKEMTDQECYENIRNNPDKFGMPAEEWKKKRLKQLKKEGKNWSE